MKTYRGVRTKDGCTVTVNGKPLDAKLNVRNHSPDGFQWGYGGSGPAQLALALLWDALTDKEFAIANYQRFKFAVIGRIKTDVWELTDRDIIFWGANLSIPDKGHLVDGFPTAAGGDPDIAF